MSRSRKTLKKNAKKTDDAYTFNDFLLHPWNDQMKDVERYTFVVFDKPESKTYTKAQGGTFKRLRVPVYNLGGSRTDLPLGYLPLPTRYLPHWKQLCYTVVYHKCMHNALNTLSKQKDFPSARDCARSISAILKYYLYCRGKIIEEIFSMKGRDFKTLPTFDEYIIKERWDLHWTDHSMIKGQDGAKYLGKSPFVGVVAKSLSEWFFKLHCCFI
jgi:hypothetical protein